MYATVSRIHSAQHLNASYGLMQGGFAARQLLMCCMTLKSASLGTRQAAANHKKHSDALTLHSRCIISALAALNLPLSIHAHLLLDGYLPRGQLLLHNVAIATSACVPICPVFVPHLQQLCATLSVQNSVQACKEQRVLNSAVPKGAPW